MYFILLFINLSPFSPVAGTIDANDVTPVCESDSDDIVFDSAHTIESILIGTVTDIFCNNAVRIKKNSGFFPLNYYTISGIGVQYKRMAIYME